jgi:glycosyltransferase involved in cell wall biosynthesis
MKQEKMEADLTTRVAISSNPPRVSVLIPVFNEVGAVGAVIESVAAILNGPGCPFEIIVVDDGSTDDTAQAAAAAGARVISHPYNMGNGAAVKTGIRAARGEICLLMDGDGQHTAADIPRLLDCIGPYDMVVGARIAASDTAVHRDAANLLYNWFASYVCGRKIEDLTSGFRAIKTAVAKSFVYLLPNTFSYPTTLTLAIVRSGYSLHYVPIKTARRVGKSKIRLFQDGMRFLLIILKIATLFSPLKVFLPVSLFMFLTGVGYGLFRILFMGGRYGPTSAMLMTMAVLVFMIGLVSEQIAQLRFDRAELIAPFSTSKKEER